MLNNKKRSGIALLVIASIVAFASLSNNHPVQSNTGIKMALHAEGKFVNKQEAGLKNNVPANIIHSVIASHPTSNQVAAHAIQLPNQSKKLTAYLAVQQAGIIGLFDRKQLDNPADNIFTISLDNHPNVNDKVWLTYKLTGLDDYSNVACSVNDRLAMGGYFAKKDTGTNRQRVQLNATWLQKGENRIQFGLPENAEYGYKISDLALEVEKGCNESPLAVNAGYSLYNGKAYIHGFVQEVTDNKSTVTIDGKSLALRDGEFETIVTLTDKQEAEVHAEINGKIYSKIIRFKRNVQPDKEYALNPSTEKASKTFVKGKAEILQTADAQLKVDNKALLTTQKLSLTTLRNIDLPTLDMGMSNVTDGHKGFRFLPHGEHFSDGATVALKYDRTKIPDGYTENDINTYYFDTNTKHWVALERDTVDKTLCMVVSKTTHFTDMINGVIKTPESPETQGYAPTMMNDIKAADPTAKIELIAPPTANNSGSANLSYSLEMPPARNGMSPNLAIQYNSDGGSGWLGEGWDLNIPSITVDTRWGVPRYDNTYETETYNMGGVMLATAVSDISNPDDSICTISIAHRGIQYNRLPNRQFHPRVEGGFSKIIRVGDNPSNYHWEVWDKDGTKYTYGGVGAELKGKIQSIKGLTTIQKEVTVEWKLSSMKELHNDEIKYYYDTDTLNEKISDGVYAKAIYLKKIEVIGSMGVYETIEFRSDSIKSKKTNNARYGFLASNNKLLNEVTINYLNKKLRSYAFSYKQGPFNTTLLDKVTHKDNNNPGVEIASHTFDYYNNVSYLGNKIYDETKSETWDLKQSLNSNLIALNNVIPALGGSETTSDGGSLYIGLGYDDGNWFATSNTVGYNTSGSNSITDRISSIVDINGDGLSDKIYKRNNSLFFRPNLGSGTFGDEIAILNAPGAFSLTNSKTTTDGWKGNLSININENLGVGADMGMDWSTTYSNTPIYFSDVNSDGLIDIIDNSKVWFNKIESYNNGIAIPAFTRHSSETQNPIYDIKTQTSESEKIPSEKPLTREESYVTKELKKILNASPMQDVVRVWEAPYDGTVEIDGYATYIAPIQGFDNDKFNNSDGLYLTIETQGEYLTTDPFRIYKSANPTPLRTFVTSVTVSKGQKIFFRVKCGIQENSNGDFDKVNWSPFISYIDGNEYNGLENSPIDENGYYDGSYFSSDGIVSKSGYNLIDSGVPLIHVSGNFKKTITSDSITLKVYLSNDSILLKDTIYSYFDDSLGMMMDTVVDIPVINENYKNALVYNVTFWHNNVYDDNLVFNVINDFQGKYFRFEISSESNVSWDKIKWNPELHYTRLNGKDTLVNAGVKYNVYKKILNQWSENIRFKTVDNVKNYAIISPELNFTNFPHIYKNGILQAINSDLLMVIKGSSGNNDPFHIIATKKIKLINGVIQGQKYSDAYDPRTIFSFYQSNPLSSFLYSYVCVNTNNCQSLLVEYYSDDEYIKQALETQDVAEVNVLSWTYTTTYPGVDINNPLGSVTQSVSTFCKRNDLDYGSMWRGWGQFEYNAANNRWNDPIDRSTLFLPQTKEEIGIDKMAFFPLHPDTKTKNYWVGLNENIYINGDTMSTGRLNIQNMVDLVQATNINGGLRAPALDEDTLDQISNAPILSSTNDSKSIWGGASVKLGVFNAGISASSSTGGGSTTMGYMDMNGDGYPDRITDNRIEYSSVRGGRDGEIKDIVPEKTENNAYSIGINAGATPSFSPFSLGKHFKSNQTASIVNNLSKVNLSIDLSKAINENSDNSTNTYSDINGDGLPDRLYKDNDIIKICLNLGYSFSAPMDWDLKQMQGGKNRSNGSLGIGIGTFGFGFGVQGARSSALILYSLRDMNGDGLADEVYGDGAFGTEIFYIAYNLGNSFASPVEWSTISTIQNSESNSLSGNLNLTVGYGIWPIKAVISGGLNLSNAIDRTLTDLQDIDGDGFPDLLRSTESSNTLTVNRSIIGCTNKLKTVYNPLGGKFDMEFERSQATTNHPGGKWVMNSIIVNDGIGNDGIPMKTDFEYSGGKYDRHEREFIGFANLITKSVDTDKGDDMLYRSFTQIYDTTNNYVKNNLLSSVVEDNNGNKFNVNRSEYYIYTVSKISSGTKAGNYKFQTNTPSDQSIVYSPLKYSKTLQYEGSTDSLLTTEIYSEYNIEGGNHGELSKYKFSDKGTLGSNGTGIFNYKTAIEYTSTTNPDQFYVYSLPKKVTVSDDNKTYRQMLADWTCSLNQLNQVKQVLATGDTAITDIEYNPNGTIKTKTLPRNANGQRMSFNYEYDDTLNMYVKKITDSFGYVSELKDYDYSYGIPLTSIDINGYVMTTTLDNLGRITKIKGPNEIDYTLKFYYHPQITKDANDITAPAYATTKHYDPANPTNDLETVTFVDGFGRAIQVKKDGVIDGVEKMIVSGLAKYDAFGRIKEVHYPKSGDIANKLIFDSVADIYKTETTYDILDRVLTTKLPDNTVTEMAYTLDTINKTMVTTVTDALLHSQATFTNGSGQTVKTVQYSGPNGTITTLFGFDAINQLLTVTDALDKKTISEYDMAGRRTQVTHPASGTTKFGYDPAGNLKWKYTANKDTIKYAYDYNRLKSISYPKHPENNVTYTYGTAIDASGFNRKGRLLYQEDGSGGQEFKYGKLGEMTEVRRTLVIPNQAVATYITNWTYDSWNRVQTMTYPDGEMLNYSYNTAGLLTKIGVSGSMNTYVNYINYDKFEQRTSMQYGNGTVTNYSYNPLNRRMDNLNVKVGVNYIMNNTYTYDAVSNVKSVSNTGSAANGIGGAMVHNYAYDNLYRLDSASGTFTGAGGKTAKYSLAMGYDNLHNIVSKKQDIEQFGVQFNGSLKAGYNLAYHYADNSQQISNIADESYRTEGTATKEPIAKIQNYSYDANGNLVCVNTGKIDDGKLQTTNNRKLLWDEENRLLALSDNGFVSNYFYDAAGERTVKMSGDGEGVSVNGVLSGARTGTTNFTAYISPYLVLNNGGYYSKHIYMGSQRIVSKLGSSDIFTDTVPTVKKKAYNKDFTAKFTAQTVKIKERFDSLGVVYKGTQKGDSGFITSPAGIIDIPLQYFFHSDHLGSSSLITNQSGNVVQHIEYIPFGEVFIEERNNTWSTPYKFNGKELDEETGLYYYGARYMDPRTSVWISVDPLAEKYPNISSYVYCLDNPVKFIDPTGMEVEGDAKSQSNIKNTLTVKEAKYVSFDKNGVLNKDRLNKSKSTSENMTALKVLVNSETKYKFAVAKEDANGKVFFEKGGDPSNPKNYSYGVTMMPGAENDPSPDNNVYIFTAEFLSEKKQVSNTAHEGYAHAYFYELSKSDSSIEPSHTYGIIKTVLEYDSESKKNSPSFIFGKTNIKLEERIKVVEFQAITNYEKNKK